MGSALHLRGHGGRPGHGHLLQLLLSLLNLSSEVHVVILELSLLQFQQYLMQRNESKQD